MTALPAVAYTASPGVNASQSTNAPLPDDGPTGASPTSVDGPSIQTGADRTSHGVVVDHSPTRVPSTVS